MTEEGLVDAILDREGRRYGDQHTTPPIDQPTAPGGIVLETLGEYLGRPATLDELRALTDVTVRPVILWRIRRDMRANGLDRIADEQLRLQVFDFGYNSGLALAVRWLQRVLRVPRTGSMDAPTLAALGMASPWLVHHALVAARLQMLDAWTDADGKRKQWEEGLENRALRFSRLLEEMP